MEFVYKKQYKDNTVKEQYFINNKEVDKYIFESLDNDAFDKMRNVKAEKTKGFIGCKLPVKKPTIEAAVNPEDFNEVLANIVNFIKTSKMSDGIEKLLTVMDEVSHEEYYQGYMDAISKLRDDLGVALVKMSKKHYGKR